MARENEKKCLEAVKNAILGKNNISIYSNCEISNISGYIFVATENHNANDFPDFVFDGGGIEHFELTSSKETKKGSEFKIEESRNNQIKKEYETELRNEFLHSDYVPGTMSTSNYEETYESFTYEDFLSSLRRNISNHVGSLEKSHYMNKVVFFLMEQQTARLWIDEGVLPIRFYELHKDKNALSIIKETCYSVRFLIYLVSDSIEIIDLTKIDNLLENAIVYKNVKGGRLIKHQINLFINL